MDKVKFIFFSMIAMIVILSLFNIQLISIKNKMKDGCSIDYSEYLEGEECPCLRKRFNNTIDFTYIEMSIDQSQEIQYNIDTTPHKE